MGLGLVLGLVLNAVGTDGLIANFVLEGIFQVVGAIFLASLKLLVVPLVFVSLVCGTASLEDVSKLGRVGGKTLGLYVMTTAIALTLAVLAAVVVQPGANFDLITDATYRATTPPTFAETLVGLFPTNPIRAMAEGNMLQIIVFSVLFGLAVTLSGERGKRVLAVFEDLNAVILRLVMMLMSLAPIGVFCLIARVFALQGLDAIDNLAMYFVLVLAVLVLHASVIYPTLLMLFAHLSPLAFFRSMRNPLAVAFSTASSNATLPITMENAEKRLGADRSITSFTVPLGATINMDGTAIMQGVATGFIAQAYGIDIGLGGYVTVVVTATLASIGTAGVPGVGLVMLAMVLRQVNLPVEGIGIIIGVDRLLDMVRTAVNITGDSAVTCIVAKSEGQLSLDTYERRTQD
ncbi:MAG: dicarboxylate/amino acid:cation symporter [Myxococcales bacterium]|nr:dicarboxylate/amino acid:cation symporter [Myxococcales bacterium]